MQRAKLLWGFAQASLFVNLIILLSVTLNLSWVMTHAAGGRYNSFPVSIRITYALMSVAMIFLMLMLWNHRQSPLVSAGPRLARLVSLVFVLSTLVQLASKTPDERWNAIPAAIIAYAFYYLSKHRSFAWAKTLRINFELKDLSYGQRNLPKCTEAIS